jgi:hypothetical protein
MSTVSLPYNTSVRTRVFEQFLQLQRLVFLKVVVFMNEICCTCREVVFSGGYLIQNKK